MEGLERMHPRSNAFSGGLRNMQICGKSHKGPMLCAGGQGKRGCHIKNLYLFRTLEQIS